MAKISDMLARRPDMTPVNFKAEKNLYLSLKAKLKQQNTTVKAFFEAAAKTYLSEK